MAAPRYELPVIDGADLALADLTCLLTPVAARDLEHLVLPPTPERYRPAVALAFAGLSVVQWARAAGVPRTTVMMWVNRNAVISLDGSRRLAAVLGVSADVLFEGYGNGR